MHRSSTLPALTDANQRLSKMGDELKYAWERTDNDVLLDWGMGIGLDFGKSLTRRVGNMMRLIGDLTTSTLEEGRDAARAYSNDRLGDHLKGRGEQAYASTERFISETGASLSQTFSDLKNNPADVGPQLLTMVAMTFLVSGGPDGNGGAPDLDLMVGIDAHRSVFSHSILMGASIETGLLALLRLTRLVHAKLPATRDPLWDTMARQSDGILNAASMGASMGMAYHLFVDGLIQPGAYHGIPIPMPMEAHQAIFEANAAAEALDVGHKPVPVRTKRSTGQGQPEKWVEPGSAVIIMGTHNPGATPNKVQVDWIELGPAAIIKGAHDARRRPILTLKRRAATV